MADADAMAPPKSGPEASPMGSILVPGAGDAAEVEEQLAGLAVADQEELPRPTGWEDGPVMGGGVEVSSEQLPEVVVAAAAAEVEVAEAAAADSRPRFPRRPGEPDCTYYVKFGSCRFGMKCKFNHPTRKKKSRVKGSNGGSGSGSGSNSSSNKPSSPDDEQTPKEEYGGYVPDISAEVNSLGFADKGSTSNSENKTPYEIIDVKKGRVEPNELKVAKEKRNEFIFDGSTQEECKYYSTPGGCKFGKSCKYLHRDGKEGKPEAEKADLNFLGLPLRPGEKECPYYMRTGSCKYATNCKFHHPDPSNVASKDRLEHENGGTPQQDVQGPSSQPNASIWPEHRTLNERHVPFLAPSPSYSAGMLPPQGMYPSPEWNGYHQVPLNPYYPPGVGPFQHFPAPITHPMYKPAEIPAHQQLPSDQYPERPGQPECQHFVKSGFCKFRMKCKYHHPRSPVPPPAGALSPLGLPIKPDQPVCTYYGRYGVCKYGPACAYNHPFNFGPVPAAGPPLPSQYPTPGKYTL